ncbi:MAG: protease complex subunit PrcB family protein [Pyrinomonadaceae bacterium]
MLVKKFCALAMLLSLLLPFGADGCQTRRSEGRGGKARQGGKPSPSPIPTPAPPDTAEPVTPRADGREKPVSGEIQILSRGNYGDTEEPFVFVARDAETYAALREMLKQLPAQSAEFFQTRAVVAAFLGQRRSGGYAVEIERAAQSSPGRASFRIIERAPARDAIVTMALTAPHIVAVVPAAWDESLELALDSAWQQSARRYNLTGGELTVSGGFAGVNEQSKLQGTISVLRAGRLATFLFELKKEGGRQSSHPPAALGDAASGFIEADGRVRLPRFTSFPLTGAVESPFRAAGQLADGGTKLSLTFETVPAPNIADNFSAAGRLEATASAAPTTKSTGMKKRT